MLMLVCCGLLLCCFILWLMISCGFVFYVSFCLWFDFGGLVLVRLLLLVGLLLFVSFDFIFLVLVFELFAGKLCYFVICVYLLGFTLIWVFDLCCVVHLGFTCVSD